MSAYSITTRGLPQGTLTAMGALLFGASEPGAWYDPSDLSTMFQDSAGTTPVTAVEQPVGRILDKSGRGNHASQATSAKRPTYSRRVNLLLATATLATQSITTQAAAYTLAFSGAGSVTLSGTATGVYGAGTHAITCTSGSLTLTVSGAVTDARCVLSIDAHLPYQWVNTATDYDADPAKFPGFLRFDGVDDALSTGSIDFTSTDKMTVWAGVTKLSDPSASELYGLSADPLNTAGTIMFRSSGGGGVPAAAAAYARGPVSTTLAGGAPGGAPAAFVGTVSADLGLGLTNRINGLGSTTAVALGGSFGNHPLYIGGRAGTWLYFNGRFYGLIVRGAESTLSQLEAGELYTRQKMRMP